MSLINRMLAVALLAGVLTLSSSSVLANGDPQEIMGNFLGIEMKFAKYGKYPSFIYDRVLTDYRAEIGERVKVACNGRDFAIDTARIRFISEGGCEPFIGCEDVRVYGAKLMAFCRE